MHAVLDPNVLISALLNRDGTPARLLREWTAGAFELIVSPLLLAELRRALAYPKLRKRISAEGAEAMIRWLERAATISADPDDEPPVRSPDRGDDYLLALAAANDAELVPGDRHLLGLADVEPVWTAVELIDAVT